MVAIAPENKAFRPYGAATRVLYDKSDEVLMSGPAGTGKSRGILEKAHILAEKYPGARLLFLRKTRVSLTDAALVTFEEKVVPAGHPILEGASRAARKAYVYPNGSEIVVGGLDKPQKVMSTEYDWAYIQEAIECEENDWEAVTTRLRNGVIPYQQLVADTNPDKPKHWLKVRCDRGQTKLIECRHEDNPVYWDHDRNDYTEAGRNYILGKLDKLTGVRYQRLRLGKWVAAEGQIYGDWDAAVHLVDRFNVPEEWDKIWTVDYGYTNPFVWQEWRIDPDGRMVRTREIYRTKTLVEDHAKIILQVTKGQRPPSKIICDHDAEDRATLERYLGMPTLAAVKDVSPGIQAVQSRLRKAGDGKPRIFFIRDALVERDPLLDESKLPCCTEEEMDGYVWDTGGGRKRGEQPLKKDDHGCDCTRYAVADQDSPTGQWNW